MIHVRDIAAPLPPALFAQLSKAAVQAVLRQIANAARTEWIRLAGEKLHTTQAAYISGLQPIEMHPGEAVVTLLGVLPNVLEQGMPQTDMRTTLLGANVPVAGPGQKSGKHMNAKGGYYRAIPFRHRTPGATIGQAMGAAYSNHDLVADSKKLGKDVYKAAQKLAPTIAAPYGGTKWGERLPAGMAPLLKEHHAVDIYAGMVRERKTYEKATQTQYFTFRTISTSVARGWVRKATEGLHLAEEVAKHVAKIAPAAFAAYVQGATGAK